MIRTVTILPGYDCIRGPCPAPGCPGHLGLDHPRNHGVHGDEWIYVVAFEDHRAALALTVYTDLYPATAPTWGLERPLSARRQGTDVSLHVRADAGLSTTGPCDFLAGRPCISGGTSSLVARNLFRDHGDPAVPEPQPEALWRALEALCDKWYTEHLAAVAEDLRTRCPTCKGTGRRPT